MKTVKRTLRSNQTCLCSIRQRSKGSSHARFTRSRTSWDGELASYPTPGNVNLAKRGMWESREETGRLINLAQILSRCYQEHYVIERESNLWEYKIQGISLTEKHPSILPYLSLQTRLQGSVRHSLWQTRISNHLAKWSLPR